VSGSGTHNVWEATDRRFTSENLRNSLEKRPVARIARPPREKD